MKWWWPVWGEVPAEPESDQPEGIAPLVNTKSGNKHTPTKHTVFPNRMNRNKRMP